MLRFISMAWRCRCLISRQHLPPLSLVTRKPSAEPRTYSSSVTSCRSRSMSSGWSCRKWYASYALSIVLIFLPLVEQLRAALHELLQRRLQGARVLAPRVGHGEPEPQTHEIDLRVPVLADVVVLRADVDEVELRPAVLPVVRDLVPLRGAEPRRPVLAVSEHDQSQRLQ